MTVFQKQVVSRVTAGVVAFVLLRWSVICFAAAISFGEEVSGRATGPAVALPFFCGVILAVIGLPLAAVALLPAAMIYKVIRVDPPVTGERNPYDHY